MSDYVHAHLKLAKFIYNLHHQSESRRRQTDNKRNRIHTIHKRAKIT